MAQLEGEIRGGGQSNFVKYRNKVIKKNTPKKVTKFRFDKNPAPKKINYKKALTQGHTKPKASKAYGSGNFSKMVKKYNPVKKKTNYGQPAQNTRYKAPAKKKSTGGAVGSAGGFYKNGYVDKKGNKVVNGRWVSPKKSAPAKKSYSAPKKSSTSYKAPVKKASNTVAKTAAPPVAKVAPKKKVSLLADDYLDQIYRNQIAELDAGDSAFKEDTKAKVDRLGRDFSTNRANVQLNQTNSLQNSAEDYAARGMMRSGAYQTNMAESNKVFGDQQARMAQNKTDDEAEYARSKADYLRGSGTQRQDAKRQQADRIAVDNAKRAAQASS